jgi:hypothetical protein
VAVAEALNIDLTIAGNERIKAFEHYQRRAGSCGCLFGSYDDVTHRAANSTDENQALKSRAPLNSMGGSWTMAWDVLELPALTEEAIRALLNNEIAAITVPEFIDEQQRQASVATLEEHPEWDFYEGTEPPLGRLGITQYEHHGAKDGYLEAVSAATAQRAALLEPLPDPVEAVIDAFAAGWSHPVGVAKEDGRPYFAGIFRRGGGGVAIHSDWGPRDGVDWVIGDIEAQLAWNLHYSPPRVGGEVIVYDYPWEPHLEEHARQRFSDYDPALFENSRKVAVSPRPGDLIVFNSRNAHAVGSSPEPNTRISVGSFIGLKPSGELVFWA